MNKLIIRKVAKLIVVAFLLLISIHFESKRNLSSDTLLGSTTHTKVEKIREDELFNVMSNDAVILFTSDKTDNKESKSILWNTSVINEYPVIYEFDLSDYESEIILNESEKIEVVKEASPFYEEILERLDPFTEVYALKNKYDELVDSGYKKIYTPYVLFIKDGKVIMSHYVNDKTKTGELKDVYMRGFEMIKGKNV